MSTTLNEARMPSLADKINAEELARKEEKASKKETKKKESKKKK